MSDGISLFSEDPDRDVDRAPDKRGPRRAARRGRRRKPLLIALVSLLVLLLGAGVLVGWYFQRIESALSGIAREDFMPGSSAASGGGGGAGDSAPRALPPPVGTNYVLMGSDSRGPDQGRSDTLMIAHVTAAKDKVYLISFPRDMWVDVQGRG